MHIDLVTLVVPEYDEAIGFFQRVLGFELVEDSPAIDLEGGAKRWVVVRPPGHGTGLLLARADGEGQAARVGDQTGGRVAFFLRVDDFEVTRSRLERNGVELVGPPRHESYGAVQVFRDPFGNRWDLLGPDKQSHRPRRS